MRAKSEEIVSALREETQNYDTRVRRDETGTVPEVGDDITTVYGLDWAVYDELVELDIGVRGVVMDLAQDSVGVVLPGSEAGVREGTMVRCTGRTADVLVGGGLIGRVMDMLGQPADGLGPIEITEARPIEHEVSGVISRESVDVPLRTGILTTDVMVPTGRRQRELIIGGHQTGETTVTVDTIPNQKGQDITCICVAISREAPTVVCIQDTLKKHEAVDYSIIMSSTASESASLQYIVSYSRAAMGKYSMSEGKDMLIIYDGLNKHAVAYRTLSLLLECSPGRKAYPGDIFYLRSRLLERACRLTKEYGGNSITALPIIETQTGGVSAYIPTDVISTTDSRIYLEADLFFAGQRSAVNAGLFVFRVGGAAQTRATKKTIGILHIDLARFQELRVFTQFVPDLDPATQQTLDHSRRLLELLKQPLYHPISMSRQTTLLYVTTNNLVDDVPLEHVCPFTLGLAGEMEVKHPDAVAEIKSIGTLSGPAVECTRTALADAKKRGSATWQV